MMQMFSFVRKLAVLILMAGLPLQNLHAFAMPLCNDEGHKTDASAQHAHDGEADNHHAHEDSTQSDVKLVCDGCSMCQVCSAPAIASVAIDVTLDAVQTPPPALTIHRSLFIPKQLKRPPRPVLA